MFTSYFNKHKLHNFDNVISIAGKCPDWYTGKEYKILAPKYWFFMKYKEDGDITFYKKMYQKEVLDLLDPLKVYNELGENSILLCYERPNEFCHRHLVAEWLMNNLNIEIIEI